MEGEISPAVPATFLQNHPNTEMILDTAAASGLVRFHSPWLAGDVVWTDELIRQAVVWLSDKMSRPILKLSDADYNEEGLQDLLAEHGPAYSINLKVFRYLQSTITGWPGGKPESERLPGDLRREHDDIFPKRHHPLFPAPRRRRHFHGRDANPSCGTWA